VTWGLKLKKAKFNTRRHPSRNSFFFLFFFLCVNHFFGVISSVSSMAPTANRFIVCKCSSRAITGVHNGKCKACYNKQRAAQKRKERKKAKALDIAPSGSKPTQRHPFPKNWYSNYKINVTYTHKIKEEEQEFLVFEVSFFFSPTHTVFF